MNCTRIAAAALLLAASSTATADGRSPEWLGASVAAQGQWAVQQLRQEMRIEVRPRLDPPGTAPIGSLAGSRAAPKAHRRGESLS